MKSSMIFFSSYISLDIFVDVENGLCVNCVQGMRLITSRNSLTLISIDNASIHGVISTITLELGISYKSA